MTFSPLALARESARRRQNSVHQYLRLTTPQRLVMEDSSRNRIWIDGNRLGKTYAGCVELIHRVRGTHPYHKTHMGPIKACVISDSMTQLVPLMAELWSMVPKDEISDKCGFEPGRGFTGKPPRLVFAHGPGAGSEIRFATYKQGASVLAGDKFHFIWLDEPPPASIYNEVVPRLIDYRGDLLLTFTPVPDMPPMKWLRDAVEAEDSIWSKHNYGLTEENVWVEGAPAPRFTQDEIDAMEAKILPFQRGMRIRGDWEPLAEGAWLDNFSDANIKAVRPSGPGVRLAVGIDHGIVGGKQAAMLVAMRDLPSGQRRVWFWDEVESDSLTTQEEDARSIMRMLERNGLSYYHIDEWVGDRPTGDGHYLKSKTNAELQFHLGRAAGGLDRKKMKVIRTPKKRSGSVVHGLTMMNSLFGTVEDGEPLGLVHPRCTRFIEFCKLFKGSSQDPTKDAGDAGRYAMERLAAGSRYVAARVYV